MDIYIIIFGYYIIAAYFVYKIAVKFGFENPWLVFIPGANCFILAQMADLPVYYGLIFFLHYFIGWYALLFELFIFYKILNRMGASPLYLIWLCLPGVQLIALWRLSEM